MRQAVSQTLYKRHRSWALSLAVDYGGSDEDRLTALLALAKACTGYTGLHKEFTSHARPIIEAALREGRKAA